LPPSAKELDAVKGKRNAIFDVDIGVVTALLVGRVWLTRVCKPGTMR
jgi:hypothetical protein